MLPASLRRDEMKGFRRRVASVVAALTILGALWTVAPGQARAATTVVDGVTDESAVVPGEVLVQLKSGFPDAPVRKAFGSKHRMVEDDAIPGLNWFVFKYSDGTKPRAKVAELLKDPDVATAAVNVGFKLHWVPNDPLYPQQWALPRINAPAAWGLSAGTKKYVALIDSGVTDGNYPELGKIVGYSYCDNSTRTTDYFGHGSETAGIAAAAAGNGVGMAGVSYASPIMEVKIFGPANAAGDPCSTYNPAYGPTDSIMSKAIYYAVNNGAGVINCSWGGYFADADVPMLKAAIDYAWSKNVPVVASSGNENASNFNNEVPARWYHVISVGASDINNNRPDPTEWGYTSDGYPLGSNWGAPGLDIAAPGNDILSTGLPPGYAVGLQGTSFAAPFVTGVVGLMLRRYPTLTSLQVKQRIWASGQKLGPYSYSWNYLGFNCLGTGQSAELGCGVIDAYKAVK
jgi:subtilisin family serine protease